MTIRNGLTVDHIYVALPAEAFDLLAPILNNRPGISRSVVESGDDKWEGIYARSRPGTYFEFLRERRSGGLGIAIGAPYGNYVDARRIREELPHLPWRSGTRVIDGEPWFDWLSLGDYLNVAQTPLNAWLMHYHQRHDVPTKRREQPVIDAFTALELSAGRELVGEFDRLASWLPGTRQSTTNGLTVALPDRDGGTITLTISFDRPGSTFELRSLRWWPTRGAAPFPREGGPWQVGNEGGQVVLSYSRPPYASNG